jgi:LuxR family maltose regulon positive regulatory protein
VTSRAVREGPGALPELGYAAPELPARFVRREHLEKRLEAGVGAGLVVVSAPAGAGKTLLLASWAAHRRGRTAWLSLEPEDAEAHRFWGRVLTAIQASCKLPADSTLARMHSAPVHDQRFVRLLVEGCDELAAPTVVVLDDLHVLTGTPAMTSLASAVRSGLGQLRLVLSTRSDPVIPVQRLRLEGHLTELRSADLCFGSEDAVRLLAGHEVEVDPEQLATLLRKTEGWAAGLRLAALSLQGSADTDATIRELAGEHRTVADYFTEEVLAAEDAATTQFLLDTCVVRRVSGDLADALTGHRDGREMLARLEHQNLFVIALDSRREWYRYHALFGDLLRHRLRSLDRDHLDVLHHRASEWYVRHGDALEAARHLNAASDWVALSRLVLRGAGAALLGVQRSALVTVLEDLPEELVDRHPEVAAAAAVAAYARYDSRAVTAHVRRARELLDQLDPADEAVTEAVLTTLEAIVAWIDSDAAREVSAAREAARLLESLTPADVPALRVYQVGVAAVEGMGLLWSGDLRAADRIFAAMLDLLAATGGMSPVLGLHLRGSRAVLKAFGGRLVEAREQVETALAVAEDSGWSFLPLSATTYLADALVRLLEADTDGCAEAIARGRACVGTLRDRHAEAALGLVEVRLLVDRSEPSAARKCLELLRARLDGWTCPPFLEQWCRIVEAEIVLAQGDARGAIASLSTATATVAGGRPQGQRMVTLARAHLLANRPSDCLDTVAPLLADPPEDHGPAAECWLLAALAHDRLREDAQAQAAVGRSVDVAAPEGIVRPYVVNGDRVLPLLRTYLRTNDDHASFVEHLVARLAGDHSPVDVAGLTEPLTNREQSVLLLLPTMMTNTEIAEELHVSVNTVKVHLKGIYRKLGVPSRRQAVARARSLGLLQGRTAHPVTS